MDFKQIETFRSVMQTRSMTVSAASLHTSQPNISRLIAKLERGLGFELFRRVGLRLVPTPEAEALYLEVQRSFVGLAAIKEIADTIRELGTGGLKIAASPALSIGVLPPALQLFRQRRPDTGVTVHTSDSATVCKWTSSGFCDFGLASYVSDMPELAVELLHQENGLCVVPSDHRLARKRRIAASDLDGEHFISLAGADRSRAEIDAAFKPDRRRLTLETPYATTICTMVSLGLGVSVVNPLVIRRLPLPNLTARPFSPAVEFRCYSVRAGHRLLPVLAAEFLDCVRDVFDTRRRGRG
ncbi:MAG: LysR family transcriptional regulator [Burkholderiales bacterium]|jgi:DNA-binding transcriptional LysR family regulator|nr:LysR family transcriptional regulator [Burkholderiales bacterium]